MSRTLDINYYVNEVPAQPLLITIIDGEGDIVNLTDIDTVTALLYDATNTAVDGIDDAVITVSDAINGKITFQWPTTSLFADAGVYQLQLEIEGAGAEDLSNILYIGVNERAGETINAWASLTDVKNLTAELVDDQTLAIAQGMIEMYVNRLYSDTFAKPKDLEHLRRAVAYQAAFVKQTAISLFGTYDVKTIQQGNVQVDFRDAGDAFVISPLAKRTCKNLSFMGNKSTRLKSPIECDYVNDWIYVRSYSNLSDAMRNMELGY